ncbi:MAG TPA: superoxide dismutase [Cu-Zn] SodC [Candidatus Polarisedimenticolia bacterium]|nr:superoxide dismutase [Cu-Zn] SodC [Candidatus Polarisedimenticolia bacterium]
MRTQACLITIGIGVLAACGPTAAEEVTVQVNLVDGEGVGRSIGTVTLTDTQHGLLITPRLEGLTPGLHGFHVHQNPQCGPAEKDGKKVAALAAGDHFDPDHASHHEGPYREGHKGDLPALFVDEAGRASLPLLAPRLKAADLKGRALMVHAGADNYSDAPEKLGGGGARVACGTIP